MAKHIFVNKKLEGLLYPDGEITYYVRINATRSQTHKCNINDEVNNFPYTDKDFILLKARELEAQVTE